jgi:hypothetical protein
MTGLGLTQENICDFLRIDRKTLRKHFRLEIDTGAIEANLRVAQALYTNATKHNNVAAQIWWTKCRMGWRETVVTEQSGTQTLQFQHLVAARAFSEQLQAERAMAERAIEGSVVMEPTDEPEPTNLWAPATE